MYGKDSYEAIYQYLINERQSTGINHFNYPKAFIEYSNDMQDIYKNIDEYNVDKVRKILIVFDDMIADMIDNRKLNSIVTDLSIRSRKLNIPLAFITQLYFKVSNNFRLNSTHLFIMKIPNKRELQEIALNPSSDINSKDFIKIYKKYTTEPYCFLVNDACKGKNADVKFDKFDNALDIIDTIRNGKRSLTNVKNNQIKLNQIY